MSKPAFSRRINGSCRTARPTQSCGFTLVELLVVIGIIALLISILMPALRKAREQAQRTQCLANMRSIMQSAQIYAAQSKGVFPTSVNTRTGEWCYAFDLKNSMNPPGGGMGLGLLLELRILDVGTAARIMHDEAMDTTGGGLLPQPGHSMDVPPGTNQWGAGVSWFASTTTYRIIYAYNYRAPSYYYTHQKKPLKPGSVKSDLLALMDMPDPRFGRQYTHKTGYNFIRIDGSGGWFADRDRKIDQLANLSDVVDGIGNPARDEQIYDLVEKGG